MEERSEKYENKYAYDSQKKDNLMIKSLLMESGTSGCGTRSGHA